MLIFACIVIPNFGGIGAISIGGEEGNYQLAPMVAIDPVRLMFIILHFVLVLHA